MPAAAITIETVRPDGTRHVFAMAQRDGYAQSVEEIPEPHAFVAYLHLADESYPVTLEELEHGHDAAHRDNNMRTTITHVLVDAAVSVLVIAGLLLARIFGWVWMDPLAGIAGALVIASWSYELIRDTGAILLDMCPDREVEQGIRHAVEGDGDRLDDLHVWRLGPSHLGAIIAVVTTGARDPEFYRARLAGFGLLSHVTMEVRRIV